MSHRIHQLDNQLANQIAAGEVVERPASVVKELLENSVDAGASRIDVDIERGGARLIRIIDNGRGIHKDDLPLALSRHATSKISSFNDLCAVRTMGFRGEALASIASISRLSLRTRQTGEEIGWQAQTEGRDMAVKVSPVAATEGTCLEVRDLFFNTPARRKFLRTEKTEFAHVEDVVKRAALANPQVAIILKHNNKVVKRFPASAEYRTMKEKVIAACGRNFINNSQFFEGQLDELKIYGWLADPSFHRSESDNQFIFINQRAVKDRLLSHAIRQSYSDRLPMGRFASYIIYIECPVTEVDVNVHPTKHEVRFRNPRQIHDFLVKLLQQCLSSEMAVVSEPYVTPSVNNSGKESEYSSGNELKDFLKTDHQTKVNESSTSYGLAAAQPDPVIQSVPVGKSFITEDAVNIHSKREAQVFNFNVNKQSDEKEELARASSGRFGVKFGYGKLWLIDYWQWLLSNLQKKLFAAQLKPLLIPRVIEVACPDLENPELFDAFLSLGIELTPAGEKQVMIRKLPALDISLPLELWEQVVSILLSQSLPTVDKDDIANRIHKIFLQYDTEASSFKFDWQSAGNLAEGYESEDWRQYALEIGHDYLLKHLGQTL